MNLFKKVCLYILTISIVFFSSPVFSSAHAFITKAFPAENENLPNAPKKISIEFNEEIQPSFHTLQVFDRNGKRVDKGNERIRNFKIFETDLRSNLPPGTYNIQWKIVSGDGHPIDGVIPFQIGNENNNTSSQTAETSGYLPHFDLIIIRWIQYISGSIYVGMLFFYLCILPKGSLQSALIEKRYRSVFHLAFIFLLVSILLSLPLEAVIQANLTWQDVWNLTIFETLITETTFGQVWLVQLFVILLLCFITFRVFSKKNNLYMWVAFILGISLLALKAVTGHAMTASNRNLAIVMDGLHLITASIWLGSLIVMVVLLPLRKKEEGKTFFRGIVHLFFPWGVFSVVILAATGVYSSFLYVPTINSLFHTGYGKVLIGKVLLFFIMLLFALLNALKARRGNGKGWSYSLWREVTTGFIVLVLAVILTNMPTAISSPGPFNEIKDLGGNSMSLEIDPNVSGLNTFNVSIKDKKGKPMTNIEQVSLIFTSKDMAMGDNTINIQKVKNGQYQIQGMYFNMAGHWNVHVHVLTKSLEDLDADFSVLVGSNQ